MNRLAGLLVVLVALCANAWMLGLEFQYCDYDDIPDVGWMIGAEPVPAGTPGGPAWQSAVRIRVYSFRPVLWTVLYGLREVCGPVARPWVFHGFFLATHALASFLLFRLLRARLDTIAAAIGGAIFAILPGGIQAASWITAGGDQLAVLFMLLAGVAGDRALRTGSRAAFAACALAAFCAVASKETAVVLLPGLAFLWVVPFAGGRPSLRRAIAPALAAGTGAATAWAVRAWALGVWEPQYWAGAHAEASHWRALGSAFRGFLIPWTPEPGSDAPGPAAAGFLRGLGIPDERLVPVLVAVAAGALLVAILGGFARGGGGRRLALVVLVALLLVAILPVLPLTGPTGLGLSRALYQAALFLAAIVAVSAGGVGRLRGLTFSAIAAFAVLSADLLSSVARAELRMTGSIRQARADVAGTMQERPGVRFILLEAPAWIGNVPFIGSDLAAAMLPPFGGFRTAPLSWPTAALLTFCPDLRNEPGPVQVLEWRAGRVVSRGPELAPIPPAIPPLEPDGSDAHRFRVRGAIPPRAVAAVRFTARSSAPGASGLVTLSAGERSLALRFSAPDSGPCVVSIPDAEFDDAWFEQPRLASVRVEGVEPAAPPELLRSVPGVDVTAPGDGGELGLASTPRVVFGASVPATAFRVLLAVVIDGRPIELAWTVAAAEVPPDASGRRTFVAETPGVLLDSGRASGSVSWAAAAALLRPRAHGRLWSVPARLRVEALDASGVNAVARSEWIPVLVVR
jgi:hypothetical protein